MALSGNTPTPNLRVMQQAKGSNINAWGDPNLNDAISRITESVAGAVFLVPQTSTYTLSVANYIADEARMGLIVCKNSGVTGPVTITTPAVTKVYRVINPSTSDLIFTSGSGLAATIKAGTTGDVACDGTNWYADVTQPRLDQLNAPTSAVNMNNQRLSNLANGNAASQDAMTVNQGTALINSATGINFPAQTGAANYLMSTNGTTPAYVPAGRYQRVSRAFFGAM